MKLTGAIFVAFFISSGHGFLPTPPESPPRCTSLSRKNRIFKSSPLDKEEGNKAERMRQILAEEAMNPKTMAESARQMKDMKPEDMGNLIKEMEGMSPVQREQLKAMGMDPDLMKKSMEIMRDNPNLMASAQKMMTNMTPEQMLEQSRLAQERMANASPEQVELAAKAIESLSPDQLDAAAELLKGGFMPGSASDPMVVDSMFRTAEMMSQPPSGGVTFQAFATLPPISILTGDREEDLSNKELAECWADGSLGATRVDRAGFERVWNEVRELFEGDIMEEARKTASKIKSKTSTKVVTATVVPGTKASTITPPRPTVGENLTAEQLSTVNEKVKNMSGEDMVAMLDDMGNMSPEQQARMKAMGVDPTMMMKTAEIMKSNPMMRKAAEAMMKNMTPEMMKKASEQAQKQMAGMSKEDYEKALERMKNGEQ